MIISIDARIAFDNSTSILILKKKALTRDRRNLLIRDRMFIKNYHQTYLAMKHKSPSH